MRFPATCPHCARTSQAEYTDSGIHELTCPHCAGKFTVYLRKHKFEMLFDLGTRALMDGYAREAVASFAGSLERFFEFYTRAATLERAAGQGEDFAGAAERLEQSWKLLSAQSERQLGAFALAYSVARGPDSRFPDPALSRQRFSQPGDSQRLPAAANRGGRLRRPRVCPDRPFADPAR